MPFPFLPFGAIFAIGVLGAILGAFGVALRLLGGISSAGHSVAAGLVTGMRDWAGRPQREEPAPSSPAAGSPTGLRFATVPRVARATPGRGGPVIEEPWSTAVPTERVRR